MSDLSPEEKKNSAYYRLVDGTPENDVPGMVTYALYKRRKIDYIVTYKINHNGAAPDAARMLEFQQSQCSQNNVDSLKKEAADTLDVLVSMVMKDANKKLAAEIRQRDEKIKYMEELCPQKNSRKSFWLGVLQSFVAAVIFMLLSILIVIAARWPVDLLGEITQKLSRDAVAPAPAP